MADQQRWFKLWCSVLLDDEVQSLSPADRWAWVALGAHTKQSGTRGTVVISLSNAALAGSLGVSPSHLLELLLRLPHVRVTPSSPDNGRVTVTWQNWSKYQEDSTVAVRVARLRSKKRREEMRREVPPQAPQGASRGDQRYTQNGEQPNDEEIDQEGGDALRGGDAEHLDLDELRDAVEVLEFLNAKTGRAYGGTKALRLIDARLREGWSVQDCRMMIARKWRGWRDDERMSQFARPSTLFNRGKLESYMGEMGLTPHA